MHGLITYVGSLYALSSEPAARSDCGRVSSRLSWRCHRAAHRCKKPAVCVSSATFCLRFPAKSTGVVPFAGSSSADSFRRFGALDVVLPLAGLLLRFFLDTVGEVALAAGGGVLTAFADGGGVLTAAALPTTGLLLLLLLDGKFLVVVDLLGAFSIASFGGRALWALGVSAVVGVDVD